MNYSQPLQGTDQQLGAAIGSKRSSTDCESLQKQQAYARECAIQSAMCGQAEASPIEAPPEIPEKLARIEMLMGEVRQAIEVLDNRIAPVLASSAPAANLGGAIRGSKSGLGGVLDSFGDRLEMIQSRVSDIAYRVQL